MRETVRTLHKGGTRGSLAKSDGLTVTEDEVQMFVRHVVLLVWVGSGRRCWIATSEEEGILQSACRATERGTIKLAMMTPARWPTPLGRCVIHEVRTTPSARKGLLGCATRGNVLLCVH